MRAPAGRTDVCVIGTGYVGVASAIGLAELGWNVVGHDVIFERVRALERGEPPYNERGLASALRRHLSSGRIRFTESLADAVTSARIIMLAVGTPANDDGSADLSALGIASADLSALGIGGTIVVLRSTVPPGTTDALAERLGPSVPVIYSPEFLREGTAVEDFLHPSRIVIGGADEDAMKSYVELFAQVDAPVMYTSAVEAELIKGFANTFLAARISLANEAANLCDAVGADALRVLAGVGADPRIGRSFLQPGIGFGGPCLEKDTRSLRHVACAAGVRAPMLSAILEVNDAQPSRIVAMLEDEAGPINGRTIGIWGLTYKAGTDDVRHSLALSIVDEIVAKGARVRAYDPALADVPRLVKCELVQDALTAARADALVVLTDWPEFCTIPGEAIAAALRRPIVIDGRNMLDGNALQEAGIRYRGVGRGTTPRRSAVLPSSAEAVSSR